MFDWIINIKGLKQLSDQIKDLKTIVMTKAEELKNEITLLRQASAAEKAEVLEALSALESKVDDLELQVANGAGEADVQAAIDEVKAATADIKGIYNKPATSPNPGDGGTTEFPNG